MTFSCEELTSLVHGFSLVQSCDVIKNGMVRIETPFQYTDASKVDLFVGTSTDLSQKFVVTDLGQTIAGLLDVHMKPWSTKKRKEMVFDICKNLDVIQEGGEFKVYVDANRPDELPMAMVRLAQACIRVSDMALSQRYRAFALFKDEFEEIVASSDLEYSAGVSLEGRYGKNVDIDFEIHGRKVKTLVQTLSTANAATSHTLSNEVFRKWYDLENCRSQYQFLTVFDASNDVFRADDLARIETLSTTFGFPAQQDQILIALAA